MSTKAIETIDKKHPDDCQWCGKTRQTVKTFLICSFCDKVPTFSAGK